LSVAINETVGDEKDNQIKILLSKIDELNETILQLKSLQQVNNPTDSSVITDYLIAGDLRDQRRILERQTEMLQSLIDVFYSSENDFTSKATTMKSTSLRQNDEPSRPFMYEGERIHYNLLSMHDG
jgi:prefoldin subunit 5